MKTTIACVMAMMMVVGTVLAQDPPAQTPAQLAAQAEAAKVLAIPDNDAAADALVASIRAMQADPQAVKDGVPELTIAALVKTDLARAKLILPRAFSKVAEFIPVDMFRRLVAAALIAAGDGAADLTQAIISGFSANSRFLEIVVNVAKDTAAPLPVILQTAINAISATVLPPAVTLPTPYDGQ